jgi:hypothetical protein
MPTGKASPRQHLDALHIEDVQDFWPEASKAKGKYYLLIGNREWFSDDVEKLERELYQFAVEEGFTV